MNRKTQRNTIYDHLFWVALFLYTESSKNTFATSPIKYKIRYKPFA